MDEKRESVNQGMSGTNSRHVIMWYSNGYISGIPKILLSSGIEQLSVTVRLRILVPL